MLLTPKGLSANSTDRVMLLFMWARHLQFESGLAQPPFIFAGIGKPSFPVNEETVRSALHYWEACLKGSQEARTLLQDKEMSAREKREKIAALGSAINYGDPQGELKDRQIMAEALSRWYHTQLEAQHILFTVGGAAALHNIFEVINRLHPMGRIVTPFPHYSLYTGSRNRNRLHPIDVMKLPGFRLTAKAVEEAIQEAIRLGEKDGGKPSAFLLCDPSNPLGTVMSETEAREIAEVLRSYPDLYIILDEAYAEMCFDEPHSSLLGIAPDLKERIILMRSATKALSAAGERMAVTVAFNPVMMTELVQENIDICGHAPKSHQVAFAQAIEKLNVTELKNLADHYYPQVKLVEEGLQKIGAAIPDLEYKVDGTFYVLTDLSDLIGLELPEITKRALNKTGVIETDEDIAYYLLFTEHLMIEPLSYNGADGRLGYLRITCSDGDTTLENLIQRLERQLIYARQVKQERIKYCLSATLEQVRSISEVKYEEVNREFTRIIEKFTQPDVAQLKEINSELERIQLCANRYLNASVESIRTYAAIKAQSFFRGYFGRREAEKQKQRLDGKWQQFIDSRFTQQKAKNMLYQMPVSERQNFSEWKFFLNEAGASASLDHSLHAQ